MPSPVTLVFAALSFIVTFTVARLVAKWWKRRQGEKKVQAEDKSQSRQVRRAKARRAGRP
ncbi:hypothetical protein [Caenimonas aquaedulcis]|uniref:Uncharacterized protein n=1 Tax=Caenimonas aquaedulcis TaxID=2793270 RepID=A0A931H2U5_9BURK|nr:hypothetical protein [Caenimonas aquaedulcis]MBG9387488.1 hypothetical protein [Caenimonas aquaedulcis]